MLRRLRIYIHRGGVKKHKINSIQSPLFQLIMILSQSFSITT
jgi:hypothetical protein